MAMAPAFSFACRSNLKLDLKDRKKLAFRLRSLRTVLAYLIFSRGGSQGSHQIPASRQSHYPPNSTNTGARCWLQKSQDISDYR